MDRLQIVERLINFASSIITIAGTALATITYIKGAEDPNWTPFSVPDIPIYGTPMRIIAFIFFGGIFAVGFAILIRSFLRIESSMKILLVATVLAIAGWQGVLLINLLFFQNVIASNWHLFGFGVAVAALGLMHLVSIASEMDSDGNEIISWGLGLAFMFVVIGIAALVDMKTENVTGNGIALNAAFFFIGLPGMIIMAHDNF